MKKLVLFAALLTIAAGVSAMDLNEWISKKRTANKTNEQILVDAKELLDNGTMTKEEFEIVKQALGL